MKSKSLLSVLAASIVLGISFITGCLLIGNDLKERSANMEQSQNGAGVTAGPLMTIQETAGFLGLSEEQVLNIMKAENAILSNNGVFTGMRLPYIKVDDQFLFSRADLLSWVQQATAERRVYSGVKMLH
ncbi:hypothetical protein C2I18_23655 [Paenibacillus sp. PK3_47]|uniref:helix-turn-helix domain-containing protein n=1 Tax=Paenibacillus sp. PK3_47 TaxID=2072642 RepID=UPI00201DD3F8|nr:helix-turn-helix domain-containing protein [Paenibacillus sp. PK3_47]UQZ36257.1 hypothetical protein C2I18_23655 [Paenibacillus sp. PK3_47]